jgi:hypothetical protein
MRPTEAMLAASMASMETPMSTITIGQESRDLFDADPHWINHAILERRKDGHEVCVVVQLDGDHLSMCLRTPACAGGGGGGRTPNPCEREVVELWAKLGLNDSDFAPGNVVAFVQQVKRYL